MKKNFTGEEKEAILKIIENFWVLVLMLLILIVRNIYI
jgi:hypothetical protein